MMRADDTFIDLNDRIYDSSIRNNLTKNNCNECSLHYICYGIVFGGILIIGIIFLIYLT